MDNETYSRNITLTFTSPQNKVRGYSSEISEQSSEATNFFFSDNDPFQRHAHSYMVEDRYLKQAHLFSEGELLKDCMLNVANA